MSRSLRIGVDARELAGKRTGVGRYLLELFREWAASPNAQRHTFHLFAPESTRAGLPDIGGLRVEVHALPGSPGTWWEQVRLPVGVRHVAPDVLFAPAYSAPARVRVPIVLTLHDVSFAAHPEWFSWREGTRRRLLARYSARTARLVLTDSEFSRREIAEHLGVDARRVRAIPLGVRPPPGDGNPTPQREPLVLFVGSIFTRRRVRDLIRAFALVARSDPRPRLAIVGDNRSHPREDLEAVARAEGVADRVALRAYVSESELQDLYARAAVFGFLSEYEGFGFTPLEALAAGVPIVVADTPIAREIYGDAATYVPVGDVCAAADAIRLLLCDERARAQALAKAPAVLARYCWTRTAQETLQAIEDACL